MVYDYSKLRGKIVEVFGSAREFAAAFPMSERALSLKMNGGRGWSQTQITRAMELLGISQDEIPAYFFVQRV